MTYNLTNMSTDGSLLTFVQGINSEASGLIAIMFLVSIFIIAFVSMKAYESKRAFTVASFITLCVSVMMLFVGLSQIYFVVLFGLMTGGGAVMLLSENG